MDAVLFTKDNCVYCTQAKALLNSKGLTYEERIIALIAPDDRVLKENQSWTNREELLAAAPAARTMPATGALWSARLAKTCMLPPC